MVLAGISHDLRTPLSRMRLALEMSGADEATRLRGDFDAMVADIEEIDAIIGQFLDFARGVNEEKARAGPRARCSRSWPNTTRDSARSRSLEKDNTGAVPLRAHGGAPCGEQPGRQRAALRRRADRDRAEEERRRGAVIEVRDRGPGIPGGETERLKRPFTRLDAARSGRGGAGLGLAIVERVARAHGGSARAPAARGRRPGRAPDALALSSFCSTSRTQVLHVLKRWNEPSAR